MGRAVHYRDYICIWAHLIEIWISANESGNFNLVPTVIKNVLDGNVYHLTAQPSSYSDFLYIALVPREHIPSHFSPSKPDCYYAT